MQTREFYLTTTLPYVNAEPHIGFALEIVQADALARYMRLMGRDVFFNTGTDEHGQKIWEAAERGGQDVRTYTDHFAGEFKKLRETLGLSYDRFIRTTEEGHYAAAQEIWRRCREAGDIYKKKYKGLYCVGDEMFLKESDLVDGRCPNHPTMTPVELEEENYFFALSKYQSKLEEYLSRPGVVVPEWRREEGLAFVRAGLEDFSISRNKERLSWGVPVSGDDTQVMYVWFDALTNYISTLGWPEGDNFKKFWDGGEVVQVAGKDQVRFQSIIWQAMLMSAGVKNTDTVFYHGFITSGGQKMSKSLGNVISPYDMVKKYGTDATRFLLLSAVDPVEDSDITWEKLDTWYTASLVNGIGNTVARVMTLAEKNLDVPVETPDAELLSRYREGMERFDFQIAALSVSNKFKAVDEFITTEEPFRLIKTQPEIGKQIIQDAVKDLWYLALHLEPFMPTTAGIIKKAVIENKKPDNLFPRLNA